MPFVYANFQERLQHQANMVSQLSFDHHYFTGPFIEHLSLPDGSTDFFRRIANCVDCTVALERYFPPVLPKGSNLSAYVWIGRNPGRQEGAEGEPFYSKAPGGSLFDKYVGYAGLVRPQVLRY